MPFAKVADPRTVVLENSDAAIPIGVNIDIFPIDGWPTGRLAMRVHRAKLRVLSGMRQVKSIRPRPGRAPHKELFLKVAKVLVRPLSMRAIIGALFRVSTRVDPETAPFLGVTMDTPEECVPREAYGEAVRLEFEGRKFAAPQDWDLVLRGLYGDDYMIEPSARVTHHAFEAFWCA
jgi:lipopolysaccharide cholinephosphotransferase